VRCGGLAKPRTYRQEARKKYLKVAQKKKKSKKEIRRDSVMNPKQFSLFF
jgi:hypothetical protein